MQGMMKNTPGPLVENIDEEANITMRNFEIVLIMRSHINPTSSATCQKTPKSKDHRSLVFLDIFKIPKIIALSLIPGHILIPIVYLLDSQRRLLCSDFPSFIPQWPSGVFKITRLCVSLNISCVSCILPLWTRERVSSNDHLEYSIWPDCVFL